MPRETKFTIDNALFSSQLKRNLLIFKEICYHGYHIESDRKNEIEYFYIISNVSNEKHILEKLSTLSSRLYYTSYTSNCNICNNELEVHESRHICNFAQSIRLSKIHIDKKNY